MRLIANPGRKVVMVAEVALEGFNGAEVVTDCESGKPLTLAELMRAFREDAGDPECGWVRITIEPHERGHWR